MQFYKGKSFDRSRKKGLSLDFFETQDLSCPNIHLQKLCSTYAWRIFCLPIKLYGPVSYLYVLWPTKEETPELKESYRMCFVKF